MTDQFAFDDSIDPYAAVDINDFIAEEDPPYQDIIPNVLRKKDRVVLTGDEGKGKSTLEDQLAIQISAGIHPFTLAPMDPQFTLRLDFENPRDEQRKRARHDMENVEIPHGMLRVVNLPQGINILESIGEDILRGWITRHRPSVVIAGPVYKMADSDLVSDKECKPFVDLWDQLRMEYDFALFLEHHMPHSTDVQGDRVHRPIGWSGWMRWPEFGFYLNPTGQLEQWRGNRRSDTKWGRFYRDVPDSPWLWSPVNKVEYTADALVKTIHKLASTGPVTQRAVEREMGITHGTFSRFLKQHRSVWDSTMAEIGQIDQWSTGPK